ncbi:hypothetical protein GCM10009737_07970 [Nocardioides lentus]|uniref:Uncharacterized protein n=1 Tax=Nocardioides lentus TaxID=338077 RepID=A0ABN2P131_9ACTN
MPTTPSVDEDEVVRRPFADFLREQSRGSTHNELTEGLHDLIAAVVETGRKGTLTLTISVAPMKKDTERLLVSDLVKVSKPQPDRKESLYFADDNGNLTRNDPNQPTFESLREVPGNTDSAAAHIKEAAR